MARSQLVNVVAEPILDKYLIGICILVIVDVALLLAAIGCGVLFHRQPSGDEKSGRSTLEGDGRILKRGSLIHKRRIT